MKKKLILSALLIITAVFFTAQIHVNKQPGGEWIYQDYSRIGGTVFYVDNAHAYSADNTGCGRGPKTPCDSLDYAIGLCTADAGDVIYVMPGHAESVAGIAGIDIDIAGVSIIGIGNGDLMPTVTLATATTATIEIAAASVKIENIKFISDLADMAIALDIKAAADGAVIENCWFTDGAAAKELVAAITIEANADNILIKNNRIQTVVGGGCARGIILEGATKDTQIIGNYILGDFSEEPIDGTNAAAVNLIVANNIVNNADAAAGFGITLHASTTGAVARNLVLNAKNTVAGVVAAACLVAENYCSNAAGAQGILVPGVDS